MSENVPVRIRLYAETYFKALTFLNELVIVAGHTVRREQSQSH